MSIEYAVNYWKKQLVDTTTKNPLLYFRGSANNSLSVAAGDLSDATWGAFAAETEVPIADIFCFDNIAEVETTLRKVVKRASVNRDEKGIHTLFLCFGFVEWVSRDGTEYVSPLLLQRAEIETVGPPVSWTLRTTSDVEVNPMLSQMLVSEFGVSLPNVISQSTFTQPLTTQEREGVHRRILAGSALVPHMLVDDTVCLSNFSYEKSALVEDIDHAFEMGLVASNRFVKALAGDEGAIMEVAGQRPVITAEELDGRHPSKEALVLDADSSQSVAIEAVLQGYDAVIDGPPGTGKSQTIANLIAALAIKGKKVLFVAEKRAAIEAVTKRLEAVGLGDIVLDIHEGVRSRRDLYRQIEETLINNGRVLRPETTTVDDELHRTRQEIMRYDVSLHGKRKPWDVSAQDCYNIISEKPNASKIQLESESLFILSGRTLAEAKETLRQFVSLDGLELERGGGNPWTPAYRLGHITTAEIASRTLETLQNYRYHTLEEMLRVFQSATAETFLPPAESFTSWRKYFELWGRAQEVFSSFKPNLYEHNLEELLNTLEKFHGNSVRSLLASITNEEYKQAKHQLQELLVREVSEEELVGRLREAVLLAYDWNIVARNSTKPKLPSVELGVLKAVYADLIESTERLERWVGAKGWTAMPIKSLLRWIEALLQSSSTLYRLPEVVSARKKLHQFGLDQIVVEATKKRMSLPQAMDLFEYVWASSVLHRAFFNDATLSGFSRETHEETIRSFVEADKQHIRLGAAKVRRTIAERSHLTLEANPQHATFVRQQARLKRGQMPPRAFLSKVSNLVSTVKPCWAVSPLMVAQIIPQRQLFDVVIFDEASQIKPAEAVGAILRAKQVVVAGDPKQLPPTNFFTSNDPYEFTADDESFFVPNSESILDSVSALLHSSTFTLSWHYRSRDEKLIAFSNSQSSLYNWGLVTFPGAKIRPPLRHVLVEPPQAPEDFQRREIETVVEEVKRHAKDHPDLSLGVIAMGVKQAELIEEAVHAAQRSDDSFAEWLHSGPPAVNNEPFFVKNLERVQGDERDSVILSVGYGRDANGAMAYRFGPLNTEGGERRLNVAVTRARQTMTVVSAFTAKDMNPAKLKSEGLVMLRDYLAYVESGGEELGKFSPVKTPLSPLEEDIRATLEHHGLHVQPRFGISQPWIDFGVADAENPSQMVLAVECDNAPRRNGTVRDSERLRAENLSRLGWGYHRIWSQQWLANKEQEVVRVLDAYTKAKNLKRQTAQTSNLSGGDSPNMFVSVKLDPAKKTLPFPIPATKIGAGIGSYSKMELVELMRWIESDGLLRTEADMVREAAQVLKFGKRGPAITKALVDAAKTSRYRVDTSTF